MAVTVVVPPPPSPARAAPSSVDKLAPLQELGVGLPRSKQSWLGREQARGNALKQRPP